MICSSDECSAILLSPGPVDGFPPVQHQATLLAEMGIKVELITVPRLSGEREVSFSCPGVKINVLQLREGRGLQTLIRLADYIAALTYARAICCRSQFIEISYDPLAMLISDLAPLRPSYRIAHFHESLDSFDQIWSQKRLRKAIEYYQLVIVADEARGEHLSHQLDLREPPRVVQNYPMLSDREPTSKFISKSHDFELIYAGSIGCHQKLDCIVESLRHCPPHVYLTLLGNKDLPSAQSLALRARELGLQDRVRFPGWVAYNEMQTRLAQAHLAISLYDPQHINWRNSVGASNKRYEYMRAALPQIADMNPGVPELIEGNRVGQCVKSFSPEEIAGKISQYVNDPARRESEGLRAMKLHEDKFNYQTSFAPILKLIDGFNHNRKAVRQRPRDSSEVGHKY